MHYHFFPLHNGFNLLERWYGNKWKDVELVLYTDTVLAWYDEGEMLGGVKLINSPDLIAAGQFTESIPDKPDLPSGYTREQMMAVGTRPSNQVRARNTKWGCALSSQLS